MDNNPDVTHITKLPLEILHNIFAWLEPTDLVPASCVCRTFYASIKGNMSLCRDIYLLRLDAPVDETLDWEAEIYDFAHLEQLFDPRRSSEKDAHQLPFVCNTVTRLLSNASYSSDDDSVSQNVEHLRRLFENEVPAQLFMQQSSLFERMKSTGFHSNRQVHIPREEHQMSAKLHCLYGCPILQSGRTRSAKSYPYACSKVYDLRQYTRRTKWGPFRDDDTGRVDWEKMEAICIVLAKNVAAQWPRAEIFDEIFDTPFFGSNPGSFRYSNKPTDSDEELDKGDPYGVTGSYYRIVCFLDYSDFFHYNFSMDGLIPANAPRPPLTVGEATRVIIMKLRVNLIEGPSEEDHQDFPVVHFEGESRSLDDVFDDNANSEIRGTVRTTKEGEIRWTTMSVFNGQERWRSEGVQVGGRKSARGVVGNWFDIDYDIHGPAGPTVFWKAVDSQNPRQALLDGVSGILVNQGPEGGLLGTLDDEAEIDFMADDDDEDDDWDFDLEPISNELPGLLEDAELGEGDLEFLRHELGLD